MKWSELKVGQFFEDWEYTTVVAPEQRSYVYKKTGPKTFQEYQRRSMTPLGGSMLDANYWSLTRDIIELEPLRLIYLPSTL